MQRKPKDYALLTARGIGMGAADVIPGVSGGTIAFITGIYEELINSIKSADKEFLSLLLKFDFTGAWKHINAGFLIAVFSGILFSIFSLARVISWLLDVYPKMVWAFFFGLIIASALHIGKKITQWNGVSLALLIIGAAVAAWITIATPATSPEALWFVFISGSIAITAMILPGISGSFILLLMGQYEFILNAVKDFNILVIVVFALGCVVGIISFSNVISWFFRKYPNPTMALLTGFMIGSLNKLWPWKEVTMYRTNSAGEEVPFLERSVSPFTYSEITGEPNQLWQIITIATIGFLIIFLFDIFAERKAKKETTV